MLLCHHFLFLLPSPQQRREENICAKGENIYGHCLVLLNVQETKRRHGSPLEEEEEEEEPTLYCADDGRQYCTTTSTKTSRFLA